MGGRFEQALCIPVVVERRKAQILHTCTQGLRAGEYIKTQTLGIKLEAPGSLLLKRVKKAMAMNQSGRTRFEY